jgi:uncharacterized membrane protein YdjX (TVP38/TMEM64 family)
VLIIEKIIKKIKGFREDFGKIGFWAFGFPLGLLAMLSAIGGAVTINFFISRKLAGKKFDKVIEEKPKLKAILSKRALNRLTLETA